MLARKRSTGRLWPLLAAGMLLVFAVLSARMLYGARQEVTRAEMKARAGDETGTIRHLRRAMAYYLPGNPWVRQAKDQLLQLAARAATRREHQRARQILIELRSAIVQLRGLTQPYAATLDEVNHRIMALQQATGQLDADQRAAWLQRWQHPPRPHRAWTILALSGFFLWVGGALVLLSRGLKPDASLVPRRFWPCLALVLLGWLCFGVGLAQAFSS